MNMANGANGQRQVNALERQLSALEMRKAGKAFSAIAEALGYSSASGAYEAVHRALKKTLQEPSDELRKLELERLDEVLAALWPTKHMPEKAAVILKVMERRAKLLGLDAPARVENKTELVVDDAESIRGKLLPELTAGGAEAETGGAE